MPRDKRGLFRLSGKDGKCHREYTARLRPSGLQRGSLGLGCGDVSRRAKASKGEKVV
jgi:hypothetical protein